MKRYSNSFVGTFDPTDEKIAEIRKTISAANKKTGSKLYVKLAGRGIDRIAKMTKYYMQKDNVDEKRASYFARYNAQSYIPISLATTVDVYIYER
mgnify:FL=1